MGGLQLGEAVVNGVGGHGAAAGATDAADQAGREARGLGHADPGLAAWLTHGLLAFQQHLIAQHPRLLHGLLHQAIAAGAAAHRGLVPLGHGIGDATGQGAGRGLLHQLVVKHQQIGAAGQGHIPLKGAFGRIEV